MTRPPHGTSSLIRMDSYAARARLRVDHVRAITAEEQRKLAQLASAVYQANEEFEAYLDDLYMTCVSQTALARVLGVTQKAVQMRLRRRRQFKQATLDHDTEHERNGVKPGAGRRGTGA